MPSGKGINFDNMSSPKNCLSNCLPEGPCWHLPRRQVLLEQPPELKYDTTEGSQRKEESRHPVILILDREVQSLPWEAMKCFQTATNPQPMSRVPSLPFLFALTAAHQTNSTSVAKTGIREDKIFYVLNPDKNLSKTQARLEGPFQSMSLREGIIGEQPSLPQQENFK